MLPYRTSKQNRSFITIVMLSFFFLPFSNAALSDENPAPIEKDLGCLRKGLLRVIDTLEKQAQKGPPLFTKEEIEALKYMENYVENIERVSFARDRDLQASIKTSNANIDLLQTNHEKHLAAIGDVLSNIMQKFGALDTNMQENLKEIKAKLK